MSKIPVWPTIAASYRFVFANYVSLFGAVWLPLVISNVYSYFFTLPYLKRLGEALQSNDAAALTVASRDAFPSNLVFGALSLVVMAAISVGVTKEVQGSRERPLSVYFAFGKAELRVMGGYLLILVCGIAYILSGAFIIGSLVYLVLMVSTGSGNSLTPVVIYNSIQPYLIFAVEVSYFYFVVRLMSFMTVVTVTEMRFGLWRSWELSKGNVLALIAITLAAVVPVFVCQIVLGLAAFVPALSHMSGLVSSNPTVTIGIAIQSLVPYVPWLWLAQLIAAPILYGLYIAPAVFAYRALLQNQTV
ncbi:MAG: hypothetical protein ABSD74_04700 [Rhizomicrobium sp.]